MPQQSADDRDAGAGQAADGAQSGSEGGTQRSPGQGRQASERAAQQMPADQGGGYSGSLLNRDQLVHEASVYARNFYLQRKPGTDDAFDLVDIFQVMPYVFEIEYPRKTLRRASYFKWGSNIARFFNRRFLTPRYQIALEGIDHALEEGMIKAQHEDVWEYRLKVKMPPLGPPFILLSDHIGISGDLAEKYAKVLTGEMTEKDFKMDPAIRQQIRETERDVRHVSRKLNRALKMKKEINERIDKHTKQKHQLESRKQDLIQSGGRGSEEVRELVNDIQKKGAMIDEYEDRLKRTEYKIEDYRDELEMLREEAQDLRGEVNDSGG